MSYGFYSLSEDTPPIATVDAATAAPSTASMAFAWPATCRDGFVPVNVNDYRLHVKSDDGRIQKEIDWQEIIRLPVTTEVQKLHSKSGWMVQGFWTTLTLQRLLSKVPGTEPYNWVRLKTLSGQETVMPKSRLTQYRFIYKCDDKPLPALYGGPLWLHCFDHYVEYGIPQLAEIEFLSKEAPPHHPSQDIGFPQTAMRVQTGNYYMIHKDQIKHIRY